MIFGALNLIILYFVIWVGVRDELGTSVIAVIYLMFFFNLIEIVAIKFDRGV